jgi:hypothetical protein
MDPFHTDMPTTSEVVDRNNSTYILYIAQEIRELGEDEFYVRSETEAETEPAESILTLRHGSNRIRRLHPHN